MSLIFEMDDKGKLLIDVYHLLHELPEDRHVELAESLSCSDVVICHVMDQILSGSTESGFSGTWSTSYNEPLQKYRKEIAKNSSEIAKKEIEELETRLVDMEKLKAKYQNDYFDLYHKRAGSY
jgi:hypothetical protein